MAEVGLLPFARVALQVATQVLPRARKDWTNEGLPKVRKFTCREVYQSITENQRKI
jgi:hypothetical protein